MQKGSLFQKSSLTQEGSLTQKDSWGKDGGDNRWESGVGWGQY